MPWRVAIVRSIYKEFYISTRGNWSVLLIHGHDLISYTNKIVCRKWGSSVSLVSDYRLDNCAIGVRSLAQAKDYSSSLCVEISSEAHPSSGYQWSFPGGKAQFWEWRWPLNPYSVPRSRMSRSYTFTPPCRLHGGSETALTKLSVLVIRPLGW
jgi:hypothetical protein